MKNVLLSFCGAQDPTNKNGDDGPILSLLDIRSDFQHLILFHTPDYITQARNTSDAIKARYPQTNAHPVELTDLTDVTSHEQIFNSLRPKLANLCLIDLNTKYFISLSSGTPAMHACWLLLAASGEIQATLLHKPDEKVIRPGQPAIREINPYTRTFPLIRQPEVFIDESKHPIDDKVFWDKVKHVGIVGKSSKLIKALDMVRRTAASSANIMIRGESGSGKESIAKLIHHLSNRCDHELISKNCAAFPESLLESELFGYEKGAFTGADKTKIGLFQAADEGKLLHQEIRHIKKKKKKKVLRAIQEKEIQKVGSTRVEKINVRLICATHKNLEEMVQNSQFRHDLYYRINVLPIYWPSLNDRREDIPILAYHFLDHHTKTEGKTKTLSTEAIDFLVHHDWKDSNIRQLDNMVVRGVVMAQGDEIHPADFLESDEINGISMPIPEPYEGFDVTDFLSGMHKRIVERAMEKTKNNQAAAAKLLGISPQAVSDYLKGSSGMKDKGKKKGKKLVSVV